MESSKQKETDDGSLSQEIQNFKRWFTANIKQRDPFITRQTDALKVLGTGNAAALFAIGTILTSETKTYGHVFLVKLSVGVFFFGVMAFAYAYWCLYLWFAILDEAQEHLETVSTLEGMHETRAKFRRLRMMEGYSKAGSAVSFVAFIVGCILTGIGIITW